MWLKMSLDNVKAEYFVSKHAREIGWQQQYLLAWWEIAREQFEIARLKSQRMQALEVGTQQLNYAAQRYLSELEQLKVEYAQLNGKVPDSSILTSLVKWEINRVKGYQNETLAEKLQIE